MKLDLKRFLSEACWRGLAYSTNGDVYDITIESDEEILPTWVEPEIAAVIDIGDPKRRALRSIRAFYISIAKDLFVLMPRAERQEVVRILRDEARLSAALRAPYIRVWNGEKPVVRVCWGTEIHPEYCVCTDWSGGQLIDITMD